MITHNDKIFYKHIVFQTASAVWFFYQYGYKATADKSIDSITVDDTVVRPNTDALGRNTGKTIEVGDNKIAEEKITYAKFGDHATPHYLL